MIKPNIKYYFIIIGIFLLSVRLFAMYYVPLNDSTEARYGEIARIMLETKDWITPMHNYGEPFWAKPPLSTWVSAITMQCFGVSAFSARLPGLFLALGVLFLVFYLAKLQAGVRVARNAVMILTSSLYFFLNAGTVMTDPSLLFCIMLGITAFWQAVMHARRLWGYIFFLSLSLGLLAKGPVAVVLVCMPLFVWILWHKAYKLVWSRLPWLMGGCLSLLIALPWYILAELKTPGFLYYFIVGEHIQRFLEPGWSGDKYGFAHVAPYGMIWVYVLIGTFPWSVLAGRLSLQKCMHKMVSCHNHRENPNRDCQGAEPFRLALRTVRFHPGDCDKTHKMWLSYLWLYTLVPLIFFTFARNIIYPYVFPSLPTLALLVAVLAEQYAYSDKLEWYILRIAAICGIIFFSLTLMFIYKPALIEKSQIRVVAAYKHDKFASKLSQLVYWTYKTDYSAQFYADGHAIATLDPNILNKLLADTATHYVVVDADEKTALPAEIKAHLVPIAVITILKKHFTLLRMQHTAVQ